MKPEEDNEEEFYEFDYRPPTVAMNFFVADGADPSERIKQAEALGLVLRRATKGVNYYYGVPK